MSFTSRISRSPHAFDPDMGADAIAHVPDLPPELTGLITGAAGCSPYLSGLIAKEGAWLRAALDDPEQAATDELARLPELALDQLKPQLRVAKRRIALLTGLADLAGVWSLEQVTGWLSRLADAAVDVSLKRLVGAEIERGKIPGLGAEDAENAGGLFALSMGKGGAFELNYSSDIDLIVLFDETRFDPDDYHDARAGFIRATRKMTGLMTDLTGDGYVFRTDLRLRPDANVTPVCLSMETAERYYESVGRTWERAAYIKARAAAGDIAAGNRFLDTLTPFVWRRHLDFAAIQDAHDMRLRIRDHKKLGGRLILEGHNMKLGRGGIREIEFFTQTRQLIAGGRDKTLRVRGTVDGLAALSQAGWVEPEVADTLTDHYRAHREVEHRLQMLRDAQTHTMPNSTEGFDRLAAFMGQSVADMRADLTDRLEQVHALTEDFFAPGHVAPSDDDFGQEVTARWLTYPALRSDRAVEIFNRLKPELLTRLKDAAKPEEALLQFDGFLKGLPAGVQLFSLFEANPQLTQLIVDIAATAPALAQYLSRNSGVFDAVIGGAFFAQWPGIDGLKSSLTDTLDHLDDYESCLDGTRRWAKEWHFRIGVHHLRGLITPEQAGAQYADLAQAVVAGLWPIVVTHFEAKHGAMPGNGAVVLGMGSMGSARLNASSDLDLIVIYDADGVDASEGRRPLATRAYYARLTQAMVTALQAPMAEGKLYEVDMRLRPSGRQGPVATSLKAFEDYQRHEAWTWEHLALTRARAVAGSQMLGDQVETIRQSVLAEKSGGDTILQDVADMREKIAAAKAPNGDFDAKIGRGRMQDIELLAQTACLRAGSNVRETEAQLAAGVASGWLNAADGAVLQDAIGLFWSLQAAARLLTGEALDLDRIGEGGLRLILRETGVETPNDLRAVIENTYQQADQVISRLLGGAANTT